MTLKKECKKCKILFSKKSNCSLLVWNTKTQFCSKTCFDEYRRGKPSVSPRTIFKKGRLAPHVPLENRRRGVLNNKWKGGLLPYECQFCNLPFYMERNQFLRFRRACSAACERELKRQPHERERMKIIHRQRVSEGLHNSFRGVGKLPDLIRRSTKYKQWREEIYKRDHFTCVKCGRCGGRLNVDHIKPFAYILAEQNINSHREAEACDELWDVSNGQTLCIDCHRITPTYGGNSISSVLFNKARTGMTSYKSDVVLLMRREVKEGLKLLQAALLDVGLESNFQLIPTLKDDKGNTIVNSQLVKVRMLWRKYKVERDIWLLTPELPKNTIEQWARITAYQVGHVMNNLKNQIPFQNLIEVEQKLREARSLIYSSTGSLPTHPQHQPKERKVLETPQRPR